MAVLNLPNADEAYDLLAESGANPFMAAYRAESDDVYLADLIASIDAPIIKGIPFPQFPPAPMQERIHGHSNEHSLREAFLYYRACCRYAANLQGGFNEEARMLDFGSGWGRIVRPFLPKFQLSKIIGYEPNAWFCQTARRLNPYVAFVNGPHAPPTIFTDGEFDLVTSWSVFSHLPEFLAKAWMEEFARICRPGALLFLTTWGEQFVDWLADAERKRAAGEPIHWYADAVLDELGDIERVRRTYRAGSYVWNHRSETYGEAFIPEDAFRRLLPRTMELVVSDHTSLPQSLFVLRRKQAAFRLSNKSVHGNARPASARLLSATPHGLKAALRDFLAHNNLSEKIRKAVVAFSRR